MADRRDFAAFNLEREGKFDDFQAFNLEREGKREGPVYESRGRFPVLCSWCQEEGVRTVIRMSEVEDSSGICDVHTAEMLAEIKGRAR